MDEFEGKYVSLTSFRRDGHGVATPMWFVAEDGHLLMETDAGSGKLRRIRRDPHVRIAPCTATGRILREPVEASAEILPETGRLHVEQLLRRKYRVDRVLILSIYRLVTRLRGRAAQTGERPVALSITPT